MSNVRKITLVALFCALGIICKFFLSVDITPTVRVSTTPIPVMLSGIFLGPLWGGVCGFVTDTIGFLIKPTGVYFPGFALTMALYAVICGFAFAKRKDKPFLRIGLSVGTAQVVCSMLINTFFNSMLWGMPFVVQFLQRIGASSVSLVAYVAIVSLLYPVLNRAIKTVR